MYPVVDRESFVRSKRQLKWKRCQLKKGPSCSELSCLRAAIRSAEANPAREKREHASSEDAYLTASACLQTLYVVPRTLTDCTIQAPRSPGVLSEEIQQSQPKIQNRSQNCIACRPIHPVGWLGVREAGGCGTGGGRRH